MLVALTTPTTRGTHAWPVRPTTTTVAGASSGDGNGIVTGRGTADRGEVERGRAGRPGPIDVSRARGQGCGTRPGPRARVVPDQGARVALEAASDRTAPPTTGERGPTREASPVPVTGAPGT